MTCSRVSGLFSEQTAEAQSHSARAGWAEAGVSGPGQHPLAPHPEGRVEEDPRPAHSSLSAHVAQEPAALARSPRHPWQEACQACALWGLAARPLTHPETHDCPQG